MELRRRADRKAERPQDARRARLILLLADGRTWDEAADRIGCSRGFVANWSRRFAERRIAGLHGRHLGQVPTVLTPELEARILDMTRHTPMVDAPRWSTRQLATHFNVSHMLIARVWRKHGLSPRRMARDTTSNDSILETGAKESPMTRVSRKKVTRGPRVKKKRRSAAELNKLIIRAGTLLFGEKGYGDVSIREIADAAEVVLPTLYSLFNNKQDIYVQCFKCAARIHEERLRQILVDGLRGEAALYKTLRLGVEMNMNKSPEHRLLDRIFLDGDKPMIDKFRRIHLGNPLYRELAEVFNRGSGGNEPTMRMSILDRAYNQLPVIFSMWPELAEGAKDIDLFVQKLLQILLPAIDWKAVAAW